MEGIFHVLGHADKNSIDVNNLENTIHYVTDRSDRETKIFDAIKNGKCIDAFIVDKAHPNGNEIHSIFDNGIIVIQNERTKKLVTKLIARVGQIKRYYRELNERIPSDMRRVLNIAESHRIDGMNEW